MTDSTPAWFRGLFDEINEYRGYSLYRDILAPWIGKARTATSDIGRFMHPIYFDREDEDALLSMWNLYALSRVNDLLLLPFQDDARNHWSDARVTRREYADFFSQVGFAVITTDEYAPFHHEIVRVQQSQDDDEPISILEHLWPELVLGKMMFSRSGVEVVGGSRAIVKSVAENSTLYFTFRRLKRSTSDLSHGWGSNSQWRTTLRRDYESNGTWIYNVDGNNVLNSLTGLEEDRDGLTLEERIELCRNRCFIVTSKDDSDLWPYDDRFEEASIS